MAEQQGCLGRLKVLLIEQDVQEAQFLWEDLELAEPARFQCTWAETISRAFEILDKSSHDLLLLGLGHRDGQGLGCVEKLRTKAPGLPVIVLTAAEDESLAQEAARRGAHACLVKRQMGSRELVRTIRSSVQQTRVVTDLRRALADLETRHSVQTRMLSRTQKRLRACLRVAARAPTSETQVLQPCGEATS